METQENTTQNNDGHVNSGETGNGPIHVIVPVPEKSSRLLAAATLLLFIPKMILLIPHIVVLYGLSIAAFVLTIFGQIKVVITGSYPKNMHNIVVGILRWKIRVGAYMLGLRDEYPPFTLDK